MKNTLTRNEILNIEDITTYEKKQINYLLKPNTLGIATEIIQGRKKYLLYITDSKGLPFGINVPTESLKEVLLEAKQYIQIQSQKKRKKKVHKKTNKRKLSKKDLS